MLTQFFQTSAVAATWPSFSKNRDIFKAAGWRGRLELTESWQPRFDAFRPRQRTLAALGHTDEIGGQVESLLQGLLRVKGRPAALASPPQAQFEPAPALGDVWVLHRLWHELGFDRLHAVFRRARYTSPGTG